MHHCATPHGRQRTERSMPRYLPKQISVFWTSILENDFLRHGAPRARSTDRSTALFIPTRVHIRPKTVRSGQGRCPGTMLCNHTARAATFVCANEVAKIVIIRLFRTRALRTKTGFRRQRHGFCCARTATRTCCGDFTVRKQPNCRRTRDNLSRGYMTDG